MNKMKNKWLIAMLMLVIAALAACGTADDEGTTSGSGEKEKKVT